MTSSGPERLYWSSVPEATPATTVGERLFVEHHASRSRRTTSDPSGTVISSQTTHQVATLLLQVPDDVHPTSFDGLRAQARHCSGTLISTEGDDVEHWVDDWDLGAHHRRTWPERLRTTAGDMRDVIVSVFVPAGAGGGFVEPRWVDGSRYHYPYEFFPG